MAQGNHRTEFPRCNWLPRPLTEAFTRNGWVDTSWGNDACPSFESEYGWVVWCECKATAMRECGGARYTVINDVGQVHAAFERTADLIAWLDN